MMAEMQRERPVSVRLLEGGSGDLFRVEALGQQVANLSCGRAIGREPRDHSAGGQGRGVSHSDLSAHPQYSPLLIHRP
jgi:hypothetical protein